LHREREREREREEERHKERATERERERERESEGLRESGRCKRARNGAAASAATTSGRPRSWHDATGLDERFFSLLPLLESRDPLLPGSLYALVVVFVSMTVNSFYVCEARSEYWRTKSPSDIRADDLLTRSCRSRHLWLLSSLVKVPDFKGVRLFVLDDATCIYLTPQLQLVESVCGG
jgi:hypothetical protein